MTNYRRIGKVTCTQSRSGETWRIRTRDGPGEVAAFGELREQRVISYIDRITHHVPGLLAATPIRYIPITNCVKAIAEKKAMIRLFPRVSAYRL